MHAFLFVFALHFGNGERPGGDRWLSADKAKHFFTAAFVQSASFGGLRASGLGKTASLAGAAVTTGVVGVGKEIHDARTGGDPSLKDLAWDGAGILAVSILLRRTEP